MKHNHYYERICIDAEYFTSLLSDIASAKSTILFETYILNDDMAGKILSDALITASLRGVVVRVLVDGVGSSDLNSTFIKELNKHGVLARIYHPLPWSIQLWNNNAYNTESLTSKAVLLLGKINRRDHRKLCIIDENIVYVGSANITDHILPNQTSIKTWRETTTRIMNVDTMYLQMAFEYAWSSHKKMNIKYQEYFASVFLLNFTRKMRRHKRNLLLEKIRSSTHTIFITNAYFLPDQKILRALTRAKARNVIVKILLPSISDVLVTSLISYAFYVRLLKAGIQIYEYQPRFLHAKSLKIDDWHLVGSSNLNNRSMRHDLEVDVIIQTLDAKKTLDIQFQKDLAFSKHIRLEKFGVAEFLKYLTGKILLIFTYWF